MIQAYCFDMDGTLLDTETIWVEAIEQYLHAHGHPFSRQEADQLVYGRSWHDIHLDLVDRFEDLKMPVAEMETRIAPFFESLGRARDVRIVNSIDLLKRLAADTPVCIISGSSRGTIARGIESMGVASELAFYLGAEDYSPGKPDPACYRLAAQRLGLAAEVCMVFEDSEAGVRSAKAAGMKCVALVRQGAPAQNISAADAQLSDLADFDPAAW
ncbi:MAG: HAD family phosphatase [Verrucomicrobia bacterium]|nr:HAD family phosphatase [Verrucomicrobiota bacterium]